MVKRSVCQIETTAVSENRNMSFDTNGEIEDREVIAIGRSILDIMRL